jgi:hypothetical protein
MSLVEVKKELEVQSKEFQNLQNGNTTNIF